jgi:phosphoserine aminotransferase
MRLINFGAGPSTLPEEVLVEAQAELLDWHGCGMSVMEMSHRSSEFGQIIGQALADLRDLLAVPPNYKVLFMQGGGMAQNALVPLNLLRGRDSADFVHTGAWSSKSIAEANRYARANVVASSEASGFDHIPDQSHWRRNAGAAYLHFCGNETIGGLQFHFIPDALGDVPLVADLSSEIMSRPVDVSRFGLIFAGAQKNLGIAGLTIVIVREDLLGQASDACPAVFNYTQAAAQDSMLNTPPAYAIYMSGLVLKWLNRQAGDGRRALEVMQQRSLAKAAALYAAIDGSMLYRNHVALPDRSTMNIPFRLVDERLNQAFLEEARASGMTQLKGHKSVGGMRASLYNAMSHDGVVHLVDFMGDFEQRRA